MKRAVHPAWSCAAILFAVSCGPSNAFTCDDDAQCVDGDRHGRCEASGYCSFPDAGCPAGYRYSEHAAERFAGICVPPANADGSTSDADASMDDGPPTSGATAPSPETTAGDDAVSVTSPAETSVSDGTTSPVDPASTSGTAQTSDASSETTPGSSDETTTAPAGDPYEFCLDDTECTYPQATCMYDSWALPVCNPACSGPMAIDECPPPANGDAVPACRDIAGGEWGCVLDCTDAECPDGMFCSDSSIGPFCFWA